MFANGNHVMMGSTEDPTDGGKVAVAVFGAVGVYGVSTQSRQTTYDGVEILIQFTIGVLALLWQPGFLAPTTGEKWGDCTAVAGAR